MNYNNGIPYKHEFTFNGNVTYIYHADKGQGLPAHEHTYKHVTVCHAGRILVTKANGNWVIDKNTQPIILRENEWHEIEALEDGTVFENIFNKGDL